MSHIRDFHSQSWNNPYYAKRAGASRLKKAVIIIICVLFVGGAVYTLFYSPLLRVSMISARAQTISVDEIRRAADEEITGYAYIIFPKDQIWFIDTEAIRDALRRRFTEAKDFSVEKSRGKLLVVAHEYEPTFRLMIGDKSYFLDQEGIGMREAMLGEGEALIALSNDSAVFTKGKKLLPDSWSGIIINIHKYFATLIGVRDRVMGLDVPGKSIKVLTTEGWSAIIDPSSDIQTQLKSLSAALIGKFDVSARQRLDYIDIRYGDRIFYKWR